jgi:hypothetical protein
MKILLFLLALPIYPNSLFSQKVIKYKVQSVSLFCNGVQTSTENQKNLIGGEFILDFNDYLDLTQYLFRTSDGIISSFKVVKVSTDYKGVKIYELENSRSTEDKTTYSMQIDFKSNYIKLEWFNANSNIRYQYFYFVVMDR